MSIYRNAQWCELPNPPPLAPDVAYYRNCCEEISLAYADHDGSSPSPWEDWMQYIVEGGAYPRWEVVQNNERERLKKLREKSKR